MIAAAGRAEQAVVAPFPWGQALHTGLCLLRLPADSFWAMTPRELHAAAGGIAARMDAAPAREALEALMRRFPDNPK